MVMTACIVRLAAIHRAKGLLSTGTIFFFDSMSRVSTKVEGVINVLEAERGRLGDFEYYLWVALPWMRPTLLSAGIRSCQRIFSSIKKQNYLTLGQDMALMQEAIYTNLAK